MFDKKDKEQIKKYLLEYKEADEHYKQLSEKFIIISKELKEYENTLKLLREREKKFIEFLCDKYNLTPTELIYKIKMNK